MTPQQNYVRRYQQGLTVAPTSPLQRAMTIEELVTTYQEYYYPNPVYKLVDPYDLYLWRALDASTTATVDLINGQVTP